MDPYKIIKHPLSTEKSIRLMNDSNKLVFAVNQKANKSDIKQALEHIFKAKVISINTHISGGEKRAYVKFSAETPAIDISTKMGFM